MKNRLPPTYAHSGGNGRQTRTAAPPEPPARTPPAPPAQKAAAQLLSRVADSAGQHPVAALAIAFATGLIIAKWVKR